MNLCGYVKVTKNTQGTPESELLRKAPCEIPDPLLPAGPLDLKPNRTRSYWLTVHVPKTTHAGKYAGALTITAAGSVREIPITVEVLPIRLPDKRPMHMTNWFAYGNLAKHHRVKMWSEKYWRLLDAYAKDMAEHGQDTILVSLGLVGIWQEKDGTLSFDFSRFDRFVETFDRRGVAERIELGHVGGRRPAGWTSPIGSHNWKVNLRKGAKAVKLSPEEKTAALVAAVQKHLHEKGWLKRAMIHIADEPIPGNLESWQALSRIVHRAAPKIPRIDAIHVRDCGGELEVYCPELGYFDKWYDHLSQLQKQGKIELWFYTCCNPRGLYANRFTDYELIKPRLLHWMNYYYDARGYLHWGLAYWTDKPYKDAAKGALPPGDAWIIYPGKDGPVSSIRWEALRDGVEDFELLWLLEKEQTKAARKLGLDPAKIDCRATSKSICAQLINTLTDYSKDVGKLRAARDQILAGIIETRKEPLLIAWPDPVPRGYTAPGPVTIRGAVSAGAKVRVNDKPVRIRNDGRFTDKPVLSAQQHVIRVTASIEGGDKQLSWDYTVADEEAALVDAALRSARAAGADVRFAEDLFAQHIESFKAGKSAGVRASRPKMRAAVDRLRADEINALIEKLPKEAQKLRSWKGLTEAKRLKDYPRAKRLIERLQAKQN